MVNAIFTALVFACCGYAVLKGGRDGWRVSALFITAGIMTIFAGKLGQGWGGINIPVLMVDVMLLLGLVLVAKSSRYYWPVWLCGLHLASIATHMGAAMVGDIKPMVYYTMQSFWSIPELGIMVLGIAVDRRHGLLK